jgi:D-psicose/D-tagatose/L-ribulose 3-epimerase
VRIGVSAWVWTAPVTDDVLESLIPRAAAIGYDCVEVPLEHGMPHDAVRIGELALAHGVSLSACTVITPGLDLLVAAEREAGVAHLCRCADLAAAMGARVLAGPFYSAVGRCWRLGPGERAPLVASLADSLRAVGDHAASRGVALAIEPLNRFESSFLNTTEQGLELVAAVAHPAVGLGLDLFHMGIEEKQPADAIRAAGRSLFHLQVAENDRGTPGTGHLPWSDVALALGDVGFDGAVVLETFPFASERIASAAAVWRPLAADADTLARDGVRFLRSLLTPATSSRPEAHSTRTSAAR